MRWDVPAQLTRQEQKLVARLGKKARFYVFLREIRPRLFDVEFQRELDAAYQRPGGAKPLPPAMLAMVTLLQAYDKLSDADAVEEAALDPRWQLVLGCLGAQHAPFSQGVLSQFRARMVEHDLDKKLLARTVALAKKTGSFGWQHLKFALDSSPLLGAGRVEDTWNLIGRALSTVVDCAAKCLGVERERILREARLTLLSGPSIKAALDIDWDDDAQRADGLKRLVGEVESMERWVSAHAAAQAMKPPLCDALAALRTVLTQDLEPDPQGGGPTIRRGVAKDRMPSLGDKQMRHGRKSKTKVFNGYKRHVATTAAGQLIVGVAVAPANQAEHESTAPLLDEAEQHGVAQVALVDRGYLASPRLQLLRQQGADVLCKPWPSRNRGRFTKEDFRIDLPHRQLTCPAGATAPISESLVARFAAHTCDVCPQRPACTDAKPGRGRSVTLHPQEEFLLELRARRSTPEGRRALRERIPVEHALAKLGFIQGPRARYKGVRLNALDVRRCACLVNLQTLARTEAQQKRAA